MAEHVPDTGVDLEGLPNCPECGSARGDVCRTKEQGVALPPCRGRLLAEVRRLMAQRDELQASNTQEVLRRRELERAARYVLDNVDGWSGILDHLRHALEYQP